MRALSLRAGARVPVTMECYTEVSSDATATCSSGPGSYDNSKTVACPRCRDEIVDRCVHSDVQNDPGSQSKCFGVSPSIRTTRGIWIPNRCCLLRDDQRGESAGFFWKL